MPMLTWGGVRRDQSADDDVGAGCFYAQNLRFYFEGEVDRRIPIQRQLMPITANGTQSFAGFVPVGGGQLLVVLDSAGTLSVVQAP